MAINWLGLLGPRIKPALHPYWLLSRGLTLGVRCAAFDAEGRVCLVRHTYTPGWHFPGGGVEPGETAHAAVAKELREEAGVELTGPPSLFGVYANARASRRDHVILFVAKSWNQGEISLPNREIAEAGMFGVSDLPADTSDATRRRLGEIFNDAVVQAHW